MAGHLDWVDSARGLAILGIVAVHAAQGVSGLPGWAERLAGAGRYGVQVFFLASGLTIFLSIKRGSADPRPGVWRRFYVRRFARIALVAYAGMIANLWVFQPPRSLLGVGLTMVFLNGWSPEWFNTLILGGWVLSVVWMFYLSAPLLSKTVRSTRDAVVLVFVVVGSGLLLTELGLNLRPQWGQDFFYMWPPAQLGVIALGVLLCFLTASDVKPPGWARVGLLVAGAGALVVVVLGRVPQFGAAQYIYSVVFASGLLLLASRPLRVLVNPVTRWLGRVSFSMFIWHFFVLEGLKILAGRPLAGLWDFVALYGVGVLLSAAVGWVSYVTLERYSERMGDLVAERIAAGS